MTVKELITGMENFEFMFYNRCKKFIGEYNYSRNEIKHIYNKKVLSIKDKICPETGTSWTEVVVDL